MSSHVFHLIPHTHWDREWYLPEPALRARLVALIDDLVARLGAEPAYRTFLLDGQTVLLEDYLGVRPDREPELRALVKAGRLQTGPWYVLADELLPSGEALVRNLLLGTADAERLGGRLDVGYSPDAFGHPAALPAILNGFGLKYALVWRGVPTLAPPRATDWYRWRAPGGREVLLYHLPAEGYEVGADLPVDPQALRARWDAIRARVVPRARTRHVPVFVGADHHAAHPELPRVRDLLASAYPADAFRISRLDECLATAVTDASGLPPLEGELRRGSGHAWALQGVHSTRMPLKRDNARLELWLEREAEPLAALARRAGGGTPELRPLLDRAWRTLLQNQFHDALGGCHADAVTATMQARFQAVEALAREMTRTAVHALARHDPDAARDGRGSAAPRLFLWNGAPRPRAGVVIADVVLVRQLVRVGRPRPDRPAPAPAPVADPELVDAHGRPLPVQSLGRTTTIVRRDAARHYPEAAVADVVRVAVPAPAVSGFGLVALGVRGAGAARGAGRAGSDLVATGRTLRNRLVEVTVERDATVTVLDRRTGERFAGLAAFEDGGDVGDTYTYCPPARDRVVRGLDARRVRVVARGPWVAALAVRGRLLLPAGATADGATRDRRRVAAPVDLAVVLHAGSPLVRLFVAVENHARDHRLRIRFPTGLAGVPAAAGGPFGAVARGAVAEDSARHPIEAPVRTAPFHRHVSVALGPRGLSVFGLGTPEYELMPNGTLLVTLLRAVGELSRGSLPTRPGHAGWPTPTPGAQCLGRHEYQLALLPHTLAALEQYQPIAEAWEDAFVPVKGYFIADALAAEPTEGITLEGRGLVFSACKPAQVGSPMALRCYNALDVAVDGAWRFSEGVRNAYRARLDERETVPMVLEDRGRVLRFTAGPREIVTVLVT